MQLIAPDGQNACSPVQPLAQKYSASDPTRNTFMSPPFRPDRGAFRDRHERGRDAVAAAVSARNL
jgi:hypothetical protein